MEKKATGHHESDYITIISELKKELLYQKNLNQRLQQDIADQKERRELDKFLLENGQIVNTRMTQIKLPVLEWSSETWQR